MICRFATVMLFTLAVVGCNQLLQGQGSSRLNTKVKEYAERFPRPKIADETPIQPNVTTRYRAAMLAYGFENKFRGYHVYSATYLARLTDGNGNNRLGYIWYTYYPDSKYQGYDLSKSNRFLDLALAEDSGCKIEFRKTDIATKASIDAAFKKANPKEVAGDRPKRAAPEEKNRDDSFYQATPIDIPHWIPIVPLEALPGEGEKITCFALNQNGIARYVESKQKKTSLPTQTRRTPASR
jgi:hypothetical protein